MPLTDAQVIEVTILKMVAMVATIKAQEREIAVLRQTINQHQALIDRMTVILADTRDKGPF